MLIAKLKKTLYNSETKEAEISDERKFVNSENGDIVLATNYKQVGNHLKTISSYKQH